MLQKINISNEYKINYWPPNQDIRMISEGSCDTEDWSNDAVNSALHYSNYIFYILTLITVILNSNIISQYYSFY